MPFGYPGSCEKTILTLYPWQKSRNRGFRNRIDFSLNSASIRGTFSVIFHIFSVYFFGIDFRIDFSSSFDQITSIFCIHFGISLVTFCDTFRSFFGIYFCLHFWMPSSPNIWCPLARPWGYFSDLWLKCGRKSFGKNTTFP